MALPTVVVIGSLNHDTTSIVPIFGTPGATIIATSCIEGVGGKGANQALATQRLSSRKRGSVEKKVNVKMIGAVGEDEWGEKLLSTLKVDGVDVSQIRRVTEPTGRAYIQVESKTGDSQVVLHPGANYDLHANEFDSLESVGGEAGAKPDLLILQLEIRKSVVEKILKIAARHEIPVLLNPAPANTILVHHWKAITHLVANEGEATVMAGKDTLKLPQFKRGWQEIVDELHQKGVKYVVITLAGNGVFYSVSGTTGGTLVDAKVVPVVDSTTAGDTFIGAYASKIAQSQTGQFDMKEAIDFALRAAAHVVQRFGTQATIPWASDLLDRRDSYPGQLYGAV
jgi:ribokinase